MDILPDADLLGKTVGDLQENITFAGNAIKGTLKYVTGYTGFDSSDPELQSGNYIALHFTVPNWHDAQITVTVTNPVMLDSDGVVILRIRDKDTQTITVVASAEGYSSVTKVYTLDQLTCNQV